MDLTHHWSFAEHIINQYEHGTHESHTHVYYSDVHQYWMKTLNGDIVQMLAKLITRSGHIGSLY